MQVFEGIARVPHDFGPSVVTIGNFDGVHRGHGQVLEHVVSLARRGQFASVAMTFDPHPAQVHRPQTAPQPICSLSDRLRYLRDSGLDATLVVEYSLEFARQTPEEFVRTHLVELLGMRAIVAGHDIRFGWGNEGDIDTLRALGRTYGFDVVVIHDVGDQVATTGRWSSSLIREALADGDVATAATMLGRNHRVTGTVVHGDHRGRELGFPTANLGSDVDGLVPADGVYAGWLRVTNRYDESDAAALPAAISVGTNPTFAGADMVGQRRVESYVLDRDDLDLYGQQVAVEFVGRVRGQVRFDSAAELVDTMHRDVRSVREILQQPTGAATP